MATKSFTAEVNKTVSLSGLVYSITLPEIPEGVHIFLNDVELKANTPVELNEDMTMKVEVDEPDPTTLAVTYSGAAVATYDEESVSNTDVVTVTPGAHAIHFEGLAVVPDVQINGDNILYGNRPIVVEETPGTKAYCQCGLSAGLPYCDGSHTKHGTGVKPIIVEVVEAGKKAICQCHRSAKLPWCDGTHKNPA